MELVDKLLRTFPIFSEETIVAPHGISILAVFDLSAP